MNALIGIVIFILGLVFSGLLYMFGVTQLTPVPYNIWLLASIIGFYLGYRIRFKNKRALRFFLMRKWIEFNGWFHKIDRKMTVGSHKLNPMQERASKLWKISLKDKDCILHCSISTKQRQVQSGSLLIILSPVQVDHSIMTIFDGNDDAKCNFYEVVIPQPHLDLACQQFDDVIDRRMSSLESDRRETVEDIMETMVRRQEEIIRANQK